MCAMNGFIQAHGFGRRPAQEAIDEGGNGRFKAEPRKAVSAGIRGKELIRKMICCSSCESTSCLILHVLLSADKQL